MHYPDLSHAFVQMTAHSKRCLESTQEVARLLGREIRVTGHDWPRPGRPARWPAPPGLLVPPVPPVPAGDARCRRGRARRGPAGQPGACPAGQPGASPAGGG